MNLSIDKAFRCALILLGAVAVTACGSNPTRDNGDLNGGASGSGATATGVDDNLDADGNPIDPNSVAGRAPKARIIYFDFDTSEIRSEYLDVIVQHGRYLAQNPDGRVRLEGHTDERGTREYNIALGERRAQSISRMLQLQGVSSAQIRNISYGEELPVDENHTPDSWAKNRRVQIIYENGVPN